MNIKLRSNNRIVTVIIFNSLATIFLEGRYAGCARVTDRHTLTDASLDIYDGFDELGPRQAEFESEHQAERCLQDAELAIRVRLAAQDYRNICAYYLRQIRSERLVQSGAPTSGAVALQNHLSDS